MFSLSYLYHALGDNSFADRAELAAFNALPAAVTGDWWAHQYVTQPNQPFSKELDERPFWNVNEKGQTFGLEPDYPCCTVNHPQGFPKFLSASWATAGVDGIAHALLSPSSLSTTLDNGVEVSIVCDTTYPFSDTLTYTVNASAPFTLHVRIPDWSDNSATTLSTPEASIQGILPDPHTGLLAIPLLGGQSSVTVVLSRSLYTVKRENGAVAIFHGPLLYSLDVGIQAKSSSPRNYGNSGPAQDDIPPKAKDWEMINTKIWNVAVDTSTLTVKSNSQGSDLPNPVWTPGGPPDYIEAQGCEIKWELDGDVPGEVPTDIKCQGDRMMLRFVPVGSAKIGMVELPTL
jgi:glycosyl hydrolase family 127 (putative beta-L-arabinofuranosidase)